MTVSTEIATSPRSTRSKDPNFSLQIQIQQKSQFEFVLRDTEESEFLDLVGFWNVAISVEIGTLCMCTLQGGVAS